LQKDRNFALAVPAFCKAGMTTIENELVKLTIAKGGYIVEATLKNSKNSKGSGQLVQLIKIIMRT
jgi:hypothetical protein